MLTCCTSMHRTKTKCKEDWITKTTERKVIHAQNTTAPPRSHMAYSLFAFIFMQNISYLTFKVMREREAKYIAESR